MTIVEAVNDKNLFQPFLGDDLTSWRQWMVALRCLYGLPVNSERGRALVQDCTGRSAAELPWGGFKSALFLVGRRAGKSRISALVGAFESLFGGHEARLAKGEIGVLPIIAPSRAQSMICWNYLRGVFETPLLEREIADVKESAQTLKLRNGIEVRVLSGDWRTSRGYAVICAIVDEACFFGVSDESYVRSDEELVRALKPALLTTKGRLIAISSPYAQRGWAFKEWRAQHGSNRNNPDFHERWTTLVWTGPSISMNPLLDQSEIDAAFERDPAAARSEFLGEWREAVEEFITRARIEALIEPGRKELMPRTRLAQDYRAGCDLSGGRRDSAALAIIHRESGKVVQDFVREWRSPFNPFSIVAEMAREVKRWGLSTLEGDAYAGTWPIEAFRTFGINYRISDKSKSELYLELLPILCGGREHIELLDNPTQTQQLLSLERRPRGSGKIDSVDHPRGAHDDVANALATAVNAGARRNVIAGGIRSMLSTERDNGVLTYG